MRLEPYSQEHVSIVCEWITEDEDLQDTFGFSGDLEEEEEAKNRIQDCKSRSQQTFVIVDQQRKDSDEGSVADQPVGRITLRFDESSSSGISTLPTMQSDNHTDPASFHNIVRRSADIELFIGKASHRRQGLGSNALRLLARYAHFVYQCNTLSAEVEEWNDAGMAFFASLGFSVVSRDDESEIARFEISGLPFQRLVEAAGAVQLRRYPQQQHQLQQSESGQPHTIQQVKCSKVEGSRVVLVPYQREHVHNYHVRHLPIFLFFFIFVYTLFIVHTYTYTHIRRLG